MFGWLTENPGSGLRRVLRGTVLGACLASPLACGSRAPARPEAVEPGDSAPVRFAWLTLEGTAVTSETTRGRATAILFLTTYDMGSQLVARQLNELVRDRRPRFNVLGVVLEPPKYAPLVEAFRDSMELSYPLAMADHATLERRGPFGGVDEVPAVFVLDRTGRVVWRKFGATTTRELKQALAKADGGGNARGRQDAASSR